jgi:hypothetical protein
MYTAIILTSLAVIFFMIFMALEEETFIGVVRSILIGFFVFFISLIFVCIIGELVETKEVLQPKIELSALKDNSSIEGRFYLFGGSIDGVDYYHYIEQKNGYKQKGKIKSDGVKIYEDGENYIQECKREFKNPVWNNWLGLFDYDCPGEIHIPKDSITTQYNIDLE